MALWRNWQTRRIQVPVPVRVCRFDPDQGYVDTVRAIRFLSSFVVTEIAATTRNWLPNDATIWLCAQGHLLLADQDRARDTAGRIALASHYRRRARRLVADMTAHGVSLTPGRDRLYSERSKVKQG